MCEHDGDSADKSEWPPVKTPQEYGFGGLCPVRRDLVDHEGTAPSRVSCTSTSGCVLVSAIRGGHDRPYRGKVAMRILTFWPDYQDYQDYHILCSVTVTERTPMDVYDVRAD